MLDHVVYAVPDLGAASEDFAARTGVRPTPGGRHPGRGTHNALVALGPERYLEIIAPDPGQPPPREPRAFGLDRLSGPRVITWAAKAPDLDARLARARAAGYDPGPAVAMSRARPDGIMLDWRLARAAEPQGDGLVPFLIDWGATPHPSASAAGGCVLVSLRGEHPEPPRILALLQALGVELPVGFGSAPALVATLDTPKGRIELR